MKKIARLGLVGIIAGNLSCWTYFKPREMFVSEMKAGAAVSTERKADALIEEYTRKTLEKYISSVVEEGKASYFSDQVRSMGIAKMVDEYWKAHERMLDLARKEEASEEEFVNAAKEICKIQKQFSIMIDYDNEKVIEAQARFVKEKVGNFRRLIKTGERARDFEELNRAAYTRHEYAEYVRRQNETSRELYDAMKKSIGAVGRLFASGEIDAIRDKIIRIYDDSVDELFAEATN